jgi:predicted NUDIX family phosphoesterase
MVVDTTHLRPYLSSEGFDLIREHTDAVLQLIVAEHHFVARELAERSPEYKQIIPYVVVRHRGDFFLLQRTAKQTESRLHHKLSLGIGGHINPEEAVERGEALFRGLDRELSEEVFVPQPHALQLIGIVNDETTDVGRVHLGVVFILDAPSRDVRVLETEKMTGRWVAAGDLALHRDAMESWSQIVHDRYIAAQ